MGLIHKVDKYNAIIEIWYNKRYEKEYTQNILLFGVRNGIIGWRWITVWCDNYCIFVLKMNF